MARCNMSIERCLGVIFIESTAEITFSFPRNAVQVEYITIYTTYIVRTHKVQVLIRIMHILHEVLHDYLQPQ